MPDTVRAWSCPMVGHGREVTPAVTTIQTQGRSWSDTMTVTLPEGESGNVRIARYEVTERDQQAQLMRAAFTGDRRLVPAGTYTGLYRAGSLWMSDTPDEKRDHAPALRAATRLDAGRVLINGLGLGMIVGALLHLDTVTHIDVVEVDPDVVALVGPHYTALAAAAGKTVTVHRGDAYTIQWPAGTRWDVAWHDVWADLCTDNLADMARLHRRYGRRVQWQGSWGRELTEHYRRREQRRRW